VAAAVLDRAPNGLPCFRLGFEAIQEAQVLAPRHIQENADFRLAGQIE
jgi:hypothetical protein